jgi:hypothetical protein
MCDLSDLPKDYCDYDLKLMEEIANKYDFGVLMDYACQRKHWRAQQTIVMLLVNSLGPYKDKTIEQRLFYLSEFWTFLLNAKANIEKKCNAVWICSEMMEIIFEKCFYCVLETHHPKPEHLELGCNFIRNLPGMSDCDRERSLLKFQDVFKKYQE